MDGVEQTQLRVTPLLDVPNDATTGQLAAMSSIQHEQQVGGRAKSVGDTDSCCHVANVLEISRGQPIVLTAANNKHVLRKIDRVVLTIILGIYFLQQLDKAALIYAAVFGLITDTGLQGDQYSWLNSIIYVAQLVIQPLVALMLVRLRIGKLVFVVVLLWGIVLACMAAARNFTGLMISRFLLGALEGFVAPAFVAITQIWWRRHEQTLRIASWYAMNGVVNMVGSLMVYGLGHVHGALFSYQIIFLCFGGLTVAYSFLVLLFLPDSPLESKFLTPEEKLIALERLRMNQMGVVSRQWKWDHARESVLDPKTWLWFCLSVSISIPSGGIGSFGPLIVQSFGFNNLSTILFNIPSGAFQVVATIGSSLIATRLRMKAPVIIALCLLPILGCALLMRLDHVTSAKSVLLAGYYCTAVTYSIPPLIYSWESQNTAGDTKRKVTTGIMFVGQGLGNIVGPQLYSVADAPGYYHGLTSSLCLYIVVVFLCLIGMLYIRFLNGTHARRRAALGKPVVVQDVSIVAVTDRMSSSSSQQRPSVTDGDAGETSPRHKETAQVGQEETRDCSKCAWAKAPPHVGEKAFADETDLRNEEFIFVY